jgi:hypothetical protein
MLGTERGGTAPGLKHPSGEREPDHLQRRLALDASTGKRSHLFALHMP